jgi:hypothetical protein
MDSREQLLVKLELQMMLAEYWNDVDTNWGRNAGEYYAEDAVFVGSEGASYNGRAKIQEFYAWREKRGARLAVHAFNNFRVTFESDTRAVCTWYLMLYAADGVPVLPSNPPISIALVTDNCVRGADGRWLYTSRNIKALFAGGVAPTNPKL